MKVTSFETSKRLHELGFDCERCSGTYNAYGEFSEDMYKYSIRAYDCHDGLMWCEEPLRLENVNCYYKAILGFEGENYIGEHPDEPQEAIFAAIIKILEDKKK